MKKENYSKKSEGELSAGIAEKREALRVIRFGTQGGKAKNIREARMIRRDVARMLTEQNARKAAK